MATLLDQLRTMSMVDCDTLDAEVAADLGPFVDCTSNQAIALYELSKQDDDGKPLYEQLIAESIQTAHWMFAKQSDATLEELAVELMMVSLSLRLAPFIIGYLHVQTNPKLAYSTPKTIKNAERIISHFNHLAPDFSPSRVCIKIPSTWEGLQACHELEKRGIATLATTLFCVEQAALAADAGCHYIAPYVNELRVHFDPTYIDTNPALVLPGLTQQYLGSLTPRPKTQVLAASLTTINQAMSLAGIHHLTLSPSLLTSLSETPAAGWSGAARIGEAARVPPDVGALIEKQAVRKRVESVMGDEAAWRLAVTRVDGGEVVRKLGWAVNAFVDAQEGLEGLVGGVEGRGKGEGAKGKGGTKEEEEGKGEGNGEGLA